MRNIALGRYTPLSTPIHRTDARVKIIAVVVMMVALFLSYGSTPLNFIVYGVIFALILTVMLIGRVSFLSIFRALKAMWFMLIFLLIINIFSKTTGDYFMIYKLKIYFNAIYNTLYIFLRLVLMIMVTTVLTATTKPMELTFGLEWLLAPLKLIRVPVSSFAMIISLALRFIPTLMEETDRIMKAQASRGVDFREGKLKEKIKAITSLIIPLFNSAIMRSGDLAISMECRGYDPRAKRTRYRTLKWSWGDSFFLVAIAVVLGGSIALAVLGHRYDLFQLFLDLFKR